MTKFWPYRPENVCRRKRRYDTWDEAAASALAVWRENPRADDANPPEPYPCDQGGERHYHYGHLRQSWRVRHRHT